MNGVSYIILGLILIILAFIGFIIARLFMRKWKKRYDSEWEYHK